MKHFLSLLWILMAATSCSQAGGDKAEVNTLMLEWSKLDPTTIGGPSELKNIKSIEEIKVGEITDSKWSTMGCKDCKEAEATFVTVTADGMHENILYKLAKMEGKWAITEWEIPGKGKGACFPPIDLEVISARKSL